MKDSRKKLEQVVKDILKDCRYHPIIMGKSWKFEWTREQGKYIYPGIPRAESQRFRQFLESAISFLSEGASAQWALSTLATKQGLRLSKRSLRTRELIMEPIVEFSSFVGHSMSKYVITMIDEIFFVDRTQDFWVAGQGLELKWELGNLLIKDRSGAFFPVDSRPDVRKRRLEKLAHFRDAITKMIEEDSVSY